MKLLLVCSLISLAYGDDDWDTYKTNHKKQYNLNEEKAHRKRFMATQLIIEAHNKKFAAGQETYTLAHNKFSDMSQDERAAHLGFRARSKTRALNHDVFDASLYDRTLPTSYDLRTSKCMPAIKNQGNCGDCWAFATVTPIEFQYCKRKNISLTMSEQQITDCTYPGEDGCDGGDHHDAWEYLYKAGGLEPSFMYPFTSGVSGLDTTCKFALCKVVVKLANVGTDIPQNETAIQTALVAKGPITFAYYVSNSFFFYKSGIFSDSNCLNDYNSLNHEMVIVGYGKNGTTPYWIIRNQWGTGWGMAGYAFILRGKNMCGIAVEAGYPTIL